MLITKLKKNTDLFARVCNLPEVAEHGVDLVTALCDGITFWMFLFGQCLGHHVNVGHTVFVGVDVTDKVLELLL